MRIRTIVIAEKEVPKLQEALAREAVKVEDITGDAKELIRKQVAKHVFLEDDLDITIKIEISEEGD